MAVKELRAMIGVDGAEPIEARGVCFFDMMENIGFSAYGGHKVTHFTWVKGADGWNKDRKPEARRVTKRPTKKAEAKLQQLDKWLKQ